jgi:palmitoyltransferase
MLLFVQFIQVSRAMTTYENMFGVNHARSAASLASAFTSTGAPLDPGSAPPPPAGSDIGPHAPSDGHGHRHGHRHGGFLKHWARLLGVDTFIETARGRGAAAGGKRKSNRNPFSRGCLANCRDFWCDPAPVFGRRETGAAVLGGVPVNYTEMYERPSVMDLLGGGGGGRRAGGYEAVAGEEV